MFNKLVVYVLFNVYEQGCLLMLRCFVAKVFAVDKVATWESLLERFTFYPVELLSASEFQSIHAPKLNSVVLLGKKN